MGTLYWRSIQVAHLEVAHLEANGAAKGLSRRQFREAGPALSRCRPVDRIGHVADWFEAEIVLMPRDVDHGVAERRRRFHRQARFGARPVDDGKAVPAGEVV